MEFLENCVKQQHINLHCKIKNCERTTNKSCKRKLLCYNYNVLMKKIFTSASLNSLAAEMTEKLENEWKNPFSPPALIFADLKVEQWFKFEFLKNSKKHILMNLKSCSLDSFLRDYLKRKLVSSGEFSETEAENLNSLPLSILRDLIYAKLTSTVKTEKGSAFYFETFDSDEVKKYLTKPGENSNETKINENNLFDFCTEIADLFLSYEIKRPEGFMKSWLAGDFFFTAAKNDSLDSQNYEQNHKTENWQKKIYADIFKNPLEFDGKIYATNSGILNFLEEKKNRKSKNENQPSEKQTAFLFAFSGIGQIYKKILDDFSISNDLYIFEQALPKKDDFKNPLSKNWAKPSIFLETQSPEEIRAEFPRDSLLHKIQSDIENDSEIKAGEYESEKSFSVLSAPSKKREIESLHSKICWLLQDENAEMSDILVVAPNIEDYKTAILQVFSQNNSSDERFPKIPFVIADSSSKNSLLFEAFTVVKNFIEKKFFSRADFASLAHNDYIQAANGFDEEDAESWTNWLSALNVYRDRKNHEDWKNAKIRLLSAKLTENVFDFACQNFLPFSDLESENNDSLLKFIDLAELLQKILDSFKSERVDSSSLEKIRALFEELFMIKGEIPQEMKSENFVYKNLMKKFDELFLVLNSGRTASFSKKYVLLSLESSLENSSYSNGKIFTGGVTFSNFKANRILSADYVFMIGMDSKSFPGDENENMLDLTLSQKMPGDESLATKNKNAFLCEILNARKGLFISYVNKDLKKDEDFYKSSVAGELSSYIKNFKEDKILISETRKWSELFTSGEFRNKINYTKLSGTSFEKSTKNEKIKAEGENEKVQNIPDRISISSVKEYLENPFAWFAKKMIYYDENDGSEEQQNLEILNFNPLDASIYTKSAAKRLISGEKLDLQKELSLENALPDGIFGEKALANINENAGTLAAKAKEFLGDEIETEKKSSFSAKNGVKNWNLTGTLSWHNKNWEKSGVLKLLDINSQKNCLSAYISSLALAASLGKDKAVNVEINVFSLKGEKSGEKNFTLTKPEAQKILSEIYNQMFIEKIVIPLPLELYEEDLASISFDDYLEKAKEGNESSFKYFSKKDLLEFEWEDKKSFEKNIGIDEKSFRSDFLSKAESHKSLIKFLQDDSESSSE